MRRYRQATSDILAALSLALLLGGVNEHNPYQYLCLAIAAMLGVASFKLNRE